MRTPFDDDFFDDDFFDDDPDFIGGDPDYFDDDLWNAEDVPDPAEEEIIRRMIRDQWGRGEFGDTTEDSGASEKLSDLIRMHPIEMQQDWIDDLGIRPQADRLKKKQIPELIANEFLMSSVMRRILLERGVAYYDAFKQSCGESGAFYPDIKSLIALKSESDLPYVVSYVDETFSVLPDVRDAFFRMDKEELREDIRLCGIIQELLPVLLDIYVILPLPVFYESVRTYAGTQRRDELLKPLLLQALKRWEEAFRLDGNRIVPVVAGKSGVVQTEAFFSEVAGRIPYCMQEYSTLDNIIRRGFPAEREAYRRLEAFLKDSNHQPQQTTDAVLTEIYYILVRHEEQYPETTRAVFADYGLVLETAEWSRVAELVKDALHDTPSPPLKGYTVRQVTEDPELRRKCSITSFDDMFFPDGEEDSFPYPEEKKSPGPPVQPEELRERNAAVVVDMKDYRKKGEKRKGKRK